MKTKINHAGRELGSKKLLAVLAVLAVTLVVLAVVPSAVAGDDQASEVVTPESLGLPDAIDGVVTLQESKEVTLTKNVTLELKTFDLNGQALSIKSSSDTEKYTLTLKSTDAKSELLANRSAEGVATIFVKGAGLALIGLAPAEGDKGASLIHMGDASTSKLGVYIGFDKSNFTIETTNSKISTIQTSECNTVFEFSNESEFTYKGGSVQNVGFVFTDSEADMTASIDGTSVAGYWNLENSTVKVKDACVYAAKLVDSTFDASGFVGLYTKEGGVNQFAQTDEKLVELELCKAELFGNSNIKAGELRCNFPSTTGTVPFVFNGNPADTDEETPVVQKVEGNLRFYDRGDNGVVAENGKVNENGFKFNNVLFSGTARHIADGVVNEVKFHNVKASEYNISLGSIIIGGTVLETTENDKTFITVISGVAKFSDSVDSNVPKNVTVIVKPGAKLVNPVNSFDSPERVVRVEGQIVIEKGGEMENHGILNLANDERINFGQKGKPQDMGRFVHVKDSRIMVDGYVNAWNHLFFFVDSHYKFKEGFFYKVRMQNFGPGENVYFGIRDITVQWDGKLIDEQRLKNAGAEVIPLVPKESLRVEAISYSPVLDQDDVVDPGFYADAVRSEVTLTYNGEGGDQSHPQTRSLFVNGDLEIIKADFSSEIVTIKPGENPTYDGTDLKNKFTFDVNYTINGDEPITIPSNWFKPIFNIKDEEGNMQPVEEVVNAGQYYVQLEATPENEIFQGMTEPIEVEVLKATTSIMLEDTTGGKFWTARAYQPGMIKITPNPLTVPITATATIEGQNPYTQDIGANDNGSAQENLDAMLSGAYLNNKAGMTYKFKVEIEETNNTFGSDYELEIKVDEFVKLDDYLTVEAVNTNSPNVPSKTDVTVEKDPENKFRYNASGPVERDSQSGDYIFYLRVTAHDLALMNQSGENGCGVEFEGSDGVEISDTLITADGKYVRLEVTVKKLPMDGIITITATPNVENLSLKPATYTVDLSSLYPVELRIVFHDTYNEITFTENLIAYAYLLDKLQGVDPDAATTAQMLRNFLQFEIGDYFLLPTPSDGKQWRLSFTDSNDEPVDQYYSGNSIYVIKEEHIDATNAIHFYASSAPAPAPETAKVIFVYGENADIRTLPFGPLEVPEDIIADAQREGFDLAWYCNGEMITEETQVADGMVVIAKYTATPVDPDSAEVFFVYGNKVMKATVERGALVVPEDIIADAQKEGFDLAWYYDGEMITEETQVYDGMIVVAQYTATPVDPDSAEVFFVYGNKVMKATVGVGTLDVPPEVSEAAKMDGFEITWYYDGVAISEETQVVDGMIVVAQYTATPVDPDTADVFFVYGNKVTKATVGVGALVIPEDIIADAQKEGFDLAWYYDGVAISEETQVYDGMIVVAQYTVSETSDKISVGISYIDGKVYYTITALDGKAIPGGMVKLITGTVTSTPWGDVIDNGVFDTKYVDMTGADHIVGSFDLHGMEIWNAYVVFEDGSNEVKSPTIKIEA